MFIVMRDDDDKTDSTNSELWRDKELLPMRHIRGYESLTLYQTASFLVFTNMLKYDG